MSKRAEELAHKLLQRIVGSGSYEDTDHAGVVSALHEYGQEVRRRDAEIALGYDDQSHDNKAEHAAAAITREPLP